MLMTLELGETVVQAVYEAMFKEWGITSCDGTRFLGLDVAYDRQVGKLTFSMGTYIKQAIERFAMADISKGLPYRNLVGWLPDVDRLLGFWYDLG
jgi:hypothetical protein